MKAANVHQHTVYPNLTWTKNLDIEVWAAYFLIYWLLNSMNHLPIFRCFLAINGSPTVCMQQLREFTNSPMSNKCYLVAVLFCACICNPVRSFHFINLALSRSHTFFPSCATDGASANKHVFLKLGESGLKHVNCQCMNAELTSPILFILHTCVYNEVYQLTGAMLQLRSSGGVTEPWPMQRKEWITSALHHLSLQQRARKHWNNLIATIWTCINY